MLISDNKTQERFPTMEELPYQDGKPVDSELQDLIAHLLKSVLAYIWAYRNDWFFGIDIGWYYERNKSAIAPDAFLSLGVQRIRGENLRLSYVTWEENEVIPSLVLEVVSKSPGGEYKKKKKIYAEYGVLYYVVYAPLRKRKRKLSIYRLNEDNKYELLEDNPVWMPEIDLGIGSEVGTYQGINREWLYWYDRDGYRYPTSEEAQQQSELQRLIAEQRQRQERQARRQAEQRQRQERQARQQAEQRQRQERQARQQAEQLAEEQRQRAEQLAARLRELGVEPDD